MSTLLALAAALALAAPATASASQTEPPHVLDLTAEAVVCLKGAIRIDYRGEITPPLPPGTVAEAHVRFIDADGNEPALGSFGFFDPSNITEGSFTGAKFLDREFGGQSAQLVIGLFPLGSGDNPNATMLASDTVDLRLPRCDGEVTPDHLVKFTQVETHCNNGILIVDLRGSADPPLPRRVKGRSLATFTIKDRQGRDHAIAGDVTVGDEVPDPNADFTISVTVDKAAAGKELTATVTLFYEELSKLIKATGTFLFDCENPKIITPVATSTTAAPASTTPTTATSPQGQLPFTGSRTIPMLVAGLLLVAAGTVAIRLTRARRG